MQYRGYELRLESGSYKVFTPEGRYIGSSPDAEGARRWVREHAAAGKRKASQDFVALGFVASPEEAVKLLSDLALYGEAYVDDDGFRVDPSNVVVAPDGSAALDTGGRVFKKAGPS